MATTDLSKHLRLYEAETHFEIVDQSTSKIVLLISRGYFRPEFERQLTAEYLWNALGLAPQLAAPAGVVEAFNKGRLLDLLEEIRKYCPDQDGGKGRAMKFMLRTGETWEALMADDEIRGAYERI